MERRKFVIGMGALAAGSAAAVGTGAFDSVQAERTAKASVVSDDSAFVELDPTNDDRAEINNDVLEVDLESGNSDSTGLNAGAQTIFNDIFTVKNNGNKPVRIVIDANSDRLYDNDQGFVEGPTGSGEYDGTLIGDNEGVEFTAKPINEDAGTFVGNTGGAGRVVLDAADRIQIDNDVAGIEEGDGNNESPILDPGQSASVTFDITTENDGEISDGSENFVILAASPDVNVE